jgi:hypothetical protein
LILKRRLGLKKEVKQALEWALAEIDGQTRYDNEEQFENSLSKAKSVLSKIGELGLKTAATTTNQT